MGVLLLVGALLSVAVGVFLSGRPGVYSSEVKISFFAPISSQNPNVLSSSSQSLIDVAGAVATAVGSGSPATPVSDSVTLAGAGVLHGWEVRLPNVGGQWATNFDQPVIDVQATGPSGPGVLATMRRLIRTIGTTLSRLQQQAQAGSRSLITTTATPATPPIFYQAPSRARTVLACAILGSGITAGIVMSIVRRRHVSSEQRSGT